MNGVSAQWDELLAAAARLMTNGEQLATLVEAINADITGTEGAWQGSASAKYQEQWAAQVQNFRTAAQNVTAMGQQVDAYVNAQIEVENAAKDGMTV